MIHPVNAGFSGSKILCDTVDQMSQSLHIIWNQTTSQDDFSDNN